MTPASPETALGRRADIHATAHRLAPRRVTLEQRGRCASWLTPFPARPRRHRQPKEDDHRLIEPDHVLVVQTTDLLPELRLPNRRDLVDYQAADGAQAISLVRLDYQPEQRGILLTCNL